MSTRRRERKARLVLLALTLRPLTGLDIRELTGLRPGALYPILDRMERDEMVFSAFAEGPYPRRRYYTITALGRSYLAVADLSPVPKVWS